MHIDKLFYELLEDSDIDSFKKKIYNNLNKDIKSKCIIKYVEVKSSYIVPVLPSGSGGKIYLTPDLNKIIKEVLNDK